MSPSALRCAEPFALAVAHEQNYPNPFNSSSTVIRFSLSESADVDLGVYALSGQRIATLASGWRPAGAYELQWDGADDPGRILASGIDVYRLKVGGETLAKRKLSLLR